MAENYEILNILSKTKPSISIYQANNKKNRSIVVLKVIDLEDSENFDDEDLLLLMNELTRLKQLSHENILNLYNCFTNDTKIWCVYPFILYGTCKDILEYKKDDGLNEYAIQLISKSILSALEYIHSKHIIHRCICPENIFISQYGTVYLSGFKFSVSLIEQGNLVRKLHDYPPKIKDYLNYIAPEVLQQNLIGYNTKSDIYSLGVTLCELANGVNPFIGCEKHQMLLEKLAGADIGLWDRTILNDEICAIENPKVIESIRQRCFSEIFRNFVDLCVTKNYQIRLNATQMLSHSFLKKLTRKSLIELLQPLQNITEKSRFIDKRYRDNIETIEETSVESNDQNSNKLLWDFE